MVIGKGEEKLSTQTDLDIKDTGMQIEMIISLIDMDRELYTLQKED